MTNLRGPRRFSKYRDAVSLQEHLEKLIDLRFGFVESRTEEAKRLMEITMEGFPAQFAKKEDVSKIDIKVDNLIEFKNQMQGKASQRSMVIALTISVISLLIASIVGVGGLLRHFKY